MRLPAIAVAIGVALPWVADAQTAQPPVPPPTPALPLWQARGTVELRVLDKVNARAVTVTGRVGTAFKYGFLTITARSCIVPPPDAASDSAAFLDIVDSRPDTPSFHGWMFADAPSVSMLEHPIYDVRVSQCR